MAWQVGAHAAFLEQFQQAPARLRFNVEVFAGLVGVFDKWWVVREYERGNGARRVQFLLQKTPHGCFAAQSAAQNRRIKADDANPGSRSRQEGGAAPHLEARQAESSQVVLLLFAAYAFVSNIVIARDEPNRRLEAADLAFKVIQ